MHITSERRKNTKRVHLVNGKGNSIFGTNVKIGEEG